MKLMLVKLMWAVVMVGVLFQPGCKKVDQSSVSKICHKWEWINTSGGIGGVVKTPDSEGYTQAVDFDEEGLYTTYMNNSVVSSGTYTIISAESELDSQVYDMVMFDNGAPAQAIRLLTDNELILREECFDCFTHTYRRD
jgi:hypothetical protein